MNHGSNYERITSRTNPTVMMLSKLKDGKYRRESGLYLAEGVKLAGEALSRCPVAYALLSEEAAAAEGEAARLCAAAEASGARLVVLSEEAFSKVSTEMAPQGVVFVLRQDPALHRAAEAGGEAALVESLAGKRVLWLADVRDPGNLGTVLRSASAFGLDCLLLSGCAELYNPKTVRASMGALFRLPTVSLADPVTAAMTLRRSGRRVLAAALTETSLTLGDYPPQAADIIIVGNEGHGIAPELLAAADSGVKIPMTPGTESLNAAVASAVLLWEYFRHG